MSHRWSNCVCPECLVIHREAISIHICGRRFDPANGMYAVQCLRCTQKRMRPAAWGMWRNVVLSSRAAAGPYDVPGTPAELPDADQVGKVGTP